jgi:hypothetical protein
MGEKGACMVLVGKPDSEDVCVDGRIILGCMFNKCDWGGKSMDWFDVAQNRDRWQALTNAVMYFWLPQNAGNFLTS